MKPMLLACALLTLAFVFFQHWSTNRAAEEIAAERATSREEIARRVPRGELIQARTAEAEARREVREVRHELAELREQLAAAQEKVRVTEAHPATPASAGSDTPINATELFKGSYTTIEDTRVYSADAQLRVGRDVVISSPSGLMLSDNDVSIVAGDLAVKTPGGTLQTTHAFIDVNAGRIDLTADSVSFTNK
jgi:hypothetical protein